MFAPFFLGSIIEQCESDYILRRGCEQLCAVALEISVTDVTGWIATKNLEHSFVILDRGPPLSKYLHQVIQYSCWKDDIAGKDGGALWV